MSKYTEKQIYGIDKIITNELVKFNINYLSIQNITEKIIDFLEAQEVGKDNSDSWDRVKKAREIVEKNTPSCTTCKINAANPENCESNTGYCFHPDFVDWKPKERSCKPCNKAACCCLPSSYVDCSDWEPIELHKIPWTLESNKTRLDIAVKICVAILSREQPSQTITIKPGKREDVIKSIVDGAFMYADAFMREARSEV